MIVVINVDVDNVDPDFVLTKTAMRRTWKAFLSGGTNHSQWAFTLPYIINRCEREGVDYKLVGCPGVGYRIEPYKGSFVYREDKSND